MVKLRFVSLAVLLFAVSLNYSCKKETEDAIECILEVAFFSFDHSVDTQDPKTVTLEITYSGDHTLDNSIKWDFGDGEVKTLNGTTTVHTYSSSGTYKARAEVTVRNGDAYCTHELEETVDIN